MSARDPEQLPVVPQHVLDKVGKPGVVLSVTDERGDPRYTAARRMAVALARATGAELILIDRSAESVWVEAYPTGSGGPRGVNVLGVEQLAALGRNEMVDQIAQAEAAGVTVRGGWLPPKPGLEGFALAVARFAPDVTVVPAEMRHPTLKERIREHLRPTTAEQVHDLVGAVVLLTVDLDGGVEVH